MKKFFFILLGLILGATLTAHAATSVFSVFQGGTGTSTPSGILYGDNSGSNPLKTVSIGSNLTFTGGTLSASGGGSAFPFTPTSYGNSTTSIIGFLNGLISNGSTTITGISGFVGANNGLLYGLASSSITTLSELSLPYTQVTGVPVFDTFAYPFPLGATSSPLMLLASTTIGSGTQIGGLTVSGGATTSGNALFQGTSQFNGNLNIGANTIYGNSFGSGDYLIMNGASGYQLENGNNGYGVNIGGDNNELTAGGEGHVFLGWNSNAGLSYFSSGVLQLGNGTYQDNTGGLIAEGSSTVGSLNVGTLGGFIGGNSGKLYAFATSSIKTSQLTNDSGFSTFAYPFTPLSNYGVTNSATTSAIWAQIGLNASSTSHLDQIQVGSTTSNNNGGLATSTFFGNVDVKGYIEDDTITNSLVFDGSGGTLNAYGGSNCSAGNAPTGINGAGTVQNCTAYSNFAFPFTINTGYNSTTTPIGFLNASNGLFALASSTLNIFQSASSTLGTVFMAQGTSTSFAVSSTTVSGTANIHTLNLPSITSALVVTSSGGATSAYGGAAGCTNQVVTALSALGATTCTTITPAMFGTAITANTVFGNATGAAAAPTFFATSSLFTIGTGLTQNANTLGLTIPVVVSSGGTNATSFSASNLTYANSGGTGLVNVGSATTTNGGIANDILSLTTTGAVNIKDIATTYTGIISPVHHLTMGWATTTTWTGTTSGAYAAIDSVEAPFSGTVQNITCQASTTKSFLGIEPFIAGAATAPAYFVASSTVGTTTLTSANTFKRGQILSMYVGTTTSDSAAIAGDCTWNITESV